MFWQLSSSVHTCKCFNKSGWQILCRNVTITNKTFWFVASFFMHFCSKKKHFANCNWVAHAPCLRHTNLINSNSPSGGIKLMECSVSNLLSLTHWWNWQSSITTTGLPERAGSESLLLPNVPFPFASITILSLMPNLHSGIPDKYDFITTLPATWADNTCPVKNVH